MSYFITFSVDTTTYPSVFDRIDMCEAIAGIMGVDDEAVEFYDEEMEESE